MNDLFNVGALLTTENDDVYLVVKSNDINNVVMQLSLVENELTLIDNPHIRPIDIECIKWGTWKQFTLLNEEQIKDLLKDFNSMDSIDSVIRESAICFK